MMLIRANTLAKGHSGCRLQVIELLLRMLERGVHPIIPRQGSLGASGDLAPLAHMALVMIALMFLAKERLANRETAQLLSCNDLVEIMRHKLPTKINCDEDLVSMIENRHRRRRAAMDRAYRKQAIMIAP